MGRGGMGRGMITGGRAAQPGRRHGNPYPYPYTAGGMA